MRCNMVKGIKIVSDKETPDYQTTLYGVSPEYDPSASLCVY